MTPNTFAFDSNFILNEKEVFSDKWASGCCRQVMSCDQAVNGKAKEGKLEREVEEKYSYKYENLIIEGKI